MGSPLYAAPLWEFSPRDEVWSQMSAYWVNTGQLDRATVTTWADGGQDEHGFYELGTQASYGNNWDQTPRSAEADAPGWDDWAGVAETGVPSSVGVW